MNAANDWPACLIGPRESIFAMGVVSIKFAELESVLTFVFATVAGLSLDVATKVATKIGTTSCLDLTRDLLRQSEWPDPTNKLVEHFLSGASVLTENRNHLMHSNLFWAGGEHTILFKTSRHGNTVAAVPTVVSQLVV